MHRIRKNVHIDKDAANYAHPIGLSDLIRSGFRFVQINVTGFEVGGLIWRSTLRSAWNLQQVPLVTIVQGTWRSILADRLFDRAAELGFYFLFALFPALFCASSILGLAARSVSQFYDHLLQYLALVIPTSALGMVVNTFNETTARASSGKITFGLVVAVWSASVGVSAIQDALNGVFKIQESRSYVMARMQAIILTITLVAIFTVALSSMLVGDFFAARSYGRIHAPWVAQIVAVASRTLGWLLAAILLTLFFAVIYYWAPDWKKKRRWQWLTPGGLFGIAGWLLASLGLRVYLHFFNSYSLTYGSLGAVIILLTWFYISGLMLLVGAEINREIKDSALRASTATGLEPVL
ncbi:YihY/virulence factor BrkB family protein [Acidicapsa dinghuensis]|uniref:YihY/virulence factor BrkB family protein n=1 Tax=Acidicapsa dinghuensis TaxID=2218256 RepID=A0ABW1EDD7_9BACT|nr:YihY/virulence factor BrkB family protein [Acidicapsa dinghuensis]